MSPRPLCRGRLYPDSSEPGFFLYRLSKITGSFACAQDDEMCSSHSSSLKPVRVPDLPEHRRFVVLHEVVERNPQLRKHAVDVGADFCGNVQRFLVVVRAHVAFLVCSVERLVDSVGRFGECVAAAKPEVERKRQFAEEFPSQTAPVTNPKFIGAQVPSATCDPEKAVLVAHACI